MQPARIAALSGDLERVIARITVEVQERNGRVALVWPQEVVGQRLRRFAGWIPTRGQKSCAKRKIVESGFLADVPSERSDVSDVEHGSETNSALDAQGCVIDAGRNVAAIQRIAEGRRSKRTLYIAIRGRGSVELLGLIKNGRVGLQIPGNAASVTR